MKGIWLIGILCMLHLQSFAGFQMKDNDRIMIPFQLVNNIIILPVHLNGVSLSFILDSGVGHTLLFSTDDQSVNFNQVRKMRFNGLGGSNEVEGLASANNHLSIGDDYTDTNHTIYIVLNEDFNFSAHLGVSVNGIIGYDFFKNYPVEIDYVARKIYIYRDIHAVRNIESRFDSLPFTLENNKPYTEVEIYVNDTYVPVKMLLDIGNADAVWIFPEVIPGFHFQSPEIEDYLGRGFNGDIRGSRGRIHSLKMGDHVLYKPIAAMPDLRSIAYIATVNGRAGSIGAEILSRFRIIMDYSGKTFYYKKNRYFNYPFRFNMSGIEVRHDGMKWSESLVKMEVETPYNSNELNDNIGTPVYNAPSRFQYQLQLKPSYSIAGIRKGSPAELAGLQEGDVLIALKGISVSRLSLENIYQILSSKEDRFIKIEVERNGEQLHKTIQLKDPLPYAEN